MSNGRQFIIVEMTAHDTPLASFTLRNPGSTIDLISEPPVTEGAERLHPSIVLIKDGDRTAITRLLQQLARVYDHIEPLETTPSGRSWLGRMRLRESAYMHNPGMKVLTSFQHRYGAPWSHLEDGVLHLRARIPDEGADLLVDQMRRYFDKAGVDAQVEVREISAKDYGVWEDLVQRAIGLAP